MTNSYQKQYAEILYNLMYNPAKKTNSRIGNVHSNFVEIIRVNLQKEFPLMEIKKIQFSNILYELLWFIKGDTHIKYLIDNGCNIWTDDAYRYYIEKLTKSNAHKHPLFQSPTLTKEEFIEYAKGRSNVCGELDRIYGKQWRSFNGKTDQLQNCINTLKSNPNDRRMIVSAHNPTDIENNIVGLPSCHNIFQFYTVPLSFEERKNLIPENIPNILTHNDLDVIGIPKYKLNIWFNIRSNDFFLGQPYNMASYALLCHIVANIVNMIPNEIVCTAIDCHLYKAHFDAAQEYIDRYNNIINGNNANTFCQSKLKIRGILKSIDDVSADDITLINYNPQSYIKAPLLT